MTFLIGRVTGRAFMLQQKSTKTLDLTWINSRKLGRLNKIWVQ